MHTARHDTDSSPLISVRRINADRGVWFPNRRYAFAKHTWIRVFWKRRRQFVRASRDAPLSDVIEMPLPQPISCPLCVLAEAQADARTGVPVFQSAMPTNQAKGWYMKRLLALVFASLV